MVPFVHLICFLHLRHTKAFPEIECLTFRSTINPEASSLNQSFGISSGINLESITYFKPSTSSAIDVIFSSKLTKLNLFELDIDKKLNSTELN